MKIKLLILVLAIMAYANPAHASLFEGEALDTVADIMSWIVLFFTPIVAVTVFWLVHILPEKIAEKRQHPQAQAIHTLCLLSLFFGGLLWPLAWLWAYSKPVMYKLAYGTDKLDPEKDTAHAKPSVNSQEQELIQLRQLVSQLESQLQSKVADPTGLA